MLPTGNQKLCIKIYCSLGICMIFKPAESHIDVSFKYLKWLLKILSEELVRRIYVLLLVVKSRGFSPLNLFHMTQCCLQYYMSYTKVTTD